MGSVEELHLGPGPALLQARRFDSVADLLVNVTPVLEDTLQDRAIVDRCGVAGDIVNQPAAGGIVEHLGDQRVRLAVVVVFGVKGVRARTMSPSAAQTACSAYVLASAAGAPGTEFG